MVAPEQILCALGVAVIVGAGFTVTVAVIGVPAHPPAVGVIVYTAVPADVEVALRACEMVEPEEAEAPLTFVCVTVHAKVAPPVLLVRLMVVVAAEQIVCELGVAVADGAGFTVTVAVIGEPAQEFAVGVIV